MLTPLKMCVWPVRHRQGQQSNTVDVLKLLGSIGVPQKNQSFLRGNARGPGGVQSQSDAEGESGS